MKLYKDMYEKNAIREEVLTAVRDNIHKTDKEFKEFKDKDVHEVIKEYLGGID